MRLRQVLSIGVRALEQIRDRVCSETIYTQLKPETHHLDYLFLNFGVVVIQVRLAGVETVPVELGRPFVPRPVGKICIDTDDTSIFVPLVCVAPDTVIANM